MTKANGSIRGMTASEELIRSIRLVAFDFDGVFTDNAVYVSEDGQEAVRCWRGDGYGLRKLDKLGIASIIVSSEPNPVVKARSEKMKINCVHGCDDKRSVLEEIASKMNISLAEVAFVGNDINDIHCLRCVGLPIVVADAHPEIVSLARYQTRKRGGFGAVREICDLFERVWASKQE